MIKQISELKRKITESLRVTPRDQLPHEFMFQESWADGQYKITIEAIPSDIYIDEKGQKWEKIKNG